MKSKIIVAAVMSAIMLCSCSDKTSGETDFTESSAASRTESTTASKTCFNGRRFHRQF